METVRSIRQVAIDIKALGVSIEEQLDDAVDHFLDVMTVPKYFAALLKDYEEGMGPSLLVESNNYTKKEQLGSPVNTWVVTNARVLCNTYRQVYYLDIARQLISDIETCTVKEERTSAQFHQLFQDLEYVCGLMRRAFIDHLSKAIPCIPAIQKRYTNVPREGTKLEVWNVLLATIGEDTSSEHKRLDALARRLCDKHTQSREAEHTVVLDLMDFVREDAAKALLLPVSVSRVISGLARVDDLQSRLSAISLYWGIQTASAAARRETILNMAKLAGTIGRLDKQIWWYCRTRSLKLNANEHLQLRQPIAGEGLNQHEVLQTLIGDLPVFLQHVDTASGQPTEYDLPPGPHTPGVQGMDLHAIFKDLVSYTHCAPESPSIDASAAKVSPAEPEKVGRVSRPGEQVAIAMDDLHMTEPIPLATSTALTQHVSQEHKQPRTELSKLGARPVAAVPETFGQRAEGARTTSLAPSRYNVSTKATKQKTRGIPQILAADERPVVPQEQVESEDEVVELEPDHYVVFQWMMNFSTTRLTADYEWSAVLQALRAAGFEGERRDNGVWIFRREGMRGVTAHEPHHGLWSRREGQDFGRRIERLGFAREMLRERV